VGFLDVLDYVRYPPDAHFSIPGQSSPHDEDDLGGIAFDQVAKARLPIIGGEQGHHGRIIGVMPFLLLDWRCSKNVDIIFASDFRILSDP
jgi:hypothetical protein